MAASGEKPLKDLYGQWGVQASDEDVRQVLALSDHDLLRLTGSAHFLAVVESNRRLRQSNERLTYWLIGFTVVLVVLTVALVWLGVVDYHRHQVEHTAPGRTESAAPPASSGGAGGGLGARRTLAWSLESPLAQRY